MKRFLILSLLLVAGFGGYRIAQSRAVAPTDWARWTQGWGSTVVRQLEGGRDALQEGLGVALPGPTPSGQQLSKYEKMLCDMANAERRKRGLSLLQIDPALADVARAHSREMAQKKYFAHESPTAARRTTLDRYRLKFKRSPRLVAENIYMMRGPKFYALTERDFRRAHEGWMKSPGHRANILRANPAGGPSRIGVGIVVQNGAFWATQNFSRPF
ncbi:MAG: hypothetical protein JWN98_2720 [Abditibacteriota bacterium]|nr:hypothetical protein [Abditibacteriota bacterium]